MAVTGTQGTTGVARHTSGSLASMLGAELVGRGDLVITRLDSLERGGEGTLTFIRSAAFASRWAGSSASAALVTRGFAVPGHNEKTRALLIVENADRAMMKVLALFAPAPEAPRSGVHPTAVIDASARIGAGVSVGPYCVVGAGASIGAGSVLAAHVSVERGASVGEKCTLHSHVSVGERCVIGRGCVLWQGVVIGADGFGYLPSEDGRGVVKVPHIGTVEIGDFVEIGANSCVDRAKFGVTVVGSGTKIDNLVQVAHNCVIGQSCLLCALVGLAGSVTLGDGVVLAGNVVVSDGNTIGAGATVGGRSAVICDIPPRETWLGQPALPASEAAKNYAAARNLAEHVQSMRKLRREMERRGLLDAPSESGVRS
jgi:UDP-3-O-[3-hydroxymyristoyl] glucosamine N-acyltransferase